ncbi:MULTISPECIES: PEP-CTERM sorting domain-containing protein [unclassified Colwellia]|uniref:PEP-CTERM sorting domain-containing protein n=1 Tax=unclassified Colwellia TaxID=196834 RepID=UPI00217518B8|nr:MULTISPECIES: PEP-CTERM sorting domain-containing protein [unclassified Colwellia]
MKLKLLISTLAGLLLTVSCMVNATLIQADFLGSNDGFYDTETELYWVDINKFSSGNISSMFSQANTMGATLATKAQIVELFGNLNGVATSTYFSIAGTKWNDFLWGYYDDSTPTGPGGQAFIRSDGQQWILDDRGDFDGHRYLGAWATYTVDVPEPSTLAIFALGLMGLASRRFKNKS